MCPYNFHSLFFNEKNGNKCWQICYCYRFTTTRLGCWSSSSLYQAKEKQKLHSNREKFVRNESHVGTKWKKVKEKHNTRSNRKEGEEKREKHIKSGLQNHPANNERRRKAKKKSLLFHYVCSVQITFIELLWQQHVKTMKMGNNNKRFKFGDKHDYINWPFHYGRLPCTNHSTTIIIKHLRICFRCSARARTNEESERTEQ